MKKSYVSLNMNGLWVTNLATAVNATDAVRLDQITNKFWGLNGNTLSATDWFGAVNNQPLVFKVNNTTQATLSTTGLGLGIAPTANLHVYKPSSTGIPTPANILSISPISRFVTLNTHLGIYTDSLVPNGVGLQVMDSSVGTALPLLLQPTFGNVAIGNSNPQALVDIAGTALITQNRTIGTPFASTGVGILNVVSPTPMTTAAIIAPESVFRMIRAGTSSVTYNASLDFKIGTYAAGINALTKAYVTLGNGATHIPEVNIMTLQSNSMVGFNTDTPTSGVTVNNSIAYAIRVITGTTTLTSTDSKIIIANGATATTITLPQASTCLGRTICFSRYAGSTGAITLTAPSSLFQAINGTVGATTTLGTHSAAGLGLYHYFTAVQINATTFVWARI